MRRHTITALCLSALAVPALAGCSTVSSTSPGKASSATAQAHRAAKGAAVSALLSSAELSKRLLDESDLGEGYTRKPQQPQRHDDVTVSGCPALDKLGGDVTVGGSLDFPRKAKASFAYEGGSNSEVAEELYSGTEDNLSKGVVLVSPAIGSCGMARPGRSGAVRCGRGDLRGQTPHVVGCQAAWGWAWCDHAVVSS